MRKDATRARRSVVWLRQSALPALLALALAGPSTRVGAQVPDGRFHVSVSLGGYLLVGVGYTHWVEEHHAVEATVYPLSVPRVGFPFGFKIGYSWIPSDEVWRAKLGGNFHMVRHGGRESGSYLTPVFAFTPGLQYDPTDDQHIRMDLWMCYFLSERVFAPSSVELLYGWKR